MLRLFTLLLMLKLGLETRIPTTGRQHHNRPCRQPHRQQTQRRADECGSVTTEYVLWAVAVIAIVGIVVAVLKAYVTQQAGNIK